MKAECNKCNAEVRSIVEVENKLCVDCYFEQQTLVTDGISKENEAWNIVMITGVQIVRFTLTVYEIYLLIGR